MTNLTFFAASPFYPERASRPRGACRSQRRRGLRRSLGRSSRLLRDPRLGSAPSSKKQALEVGVSDAADGAIKHQGVLSSRAEEYGVVGYAM